MQDHKKMIIFDFDGVIVDSMNLWFSINLVNNPELTYEQYSAMSHGNWFASFESENPMVKFTPHPEYYSEYQMGLRELPTISGLREIIHELSTLHQLVVVSSGSEGCIEEFLNRENLRSFFDEVLGSETHKSKVWKFNYLLEKYSHHPDHAIMITDTLGDILEAHEAGIKSIGVLWGLHDHETLHKGNPFQIINDPKEILNHI